MPKGHQHFYPFEDQIKSEIKTLSGKERGVLSLQVQKTCEAHERGKKGPLLYSGNVKGYIFPGFLYLLSKKAQRSWEIYDTMKHIASGVTKHLEDGFDFNGMLFLEEFLVAQKIPPKEGFKVVNFQKRPLPVVKVLQKIDGRWHCFGMLR